MKRGIDKKSRGGNGFAEWGGYMALKKRKLNAQFSGDIQRQQSNSNTSSQIFHGVTIHVNGYTVPSSDELKRLMQLHGGAYQHYYGKTKVSHIIATVLPYTKLKKLTDEKVVRPEWITDSISAGELLPCEPYQMYNQNSTAQAMLQFSTVKPANRSKDGNSFEDITQTTNDRVFDKTYVKERSVQKNTSTSVMNEKEDTIDVKEGAIGKESDSFKTPKIVKISSNLQDNLPLSNGSPKISANASGKGIAKAGDPNFVAEFYNNSRLHHISTWGAEFKAYVNSLQGKGNASFPGREKLKRLAEESLQSGSSPDSISQEFSPEQNLASTTSAMETSNKHNNSVIMHIDMDCFFVSVGLINRCDLVGKPVAVTHSKGKGMPAANKEAREFEQMYYENKMGKKKNGNKLDNSVILRHDQDTHNTGSHCKPCNKDNGYNHSQLDESHLEQSEFEHKEKSAAQDWQLVNESVDDFIKSSSENHDPGIDTKGISASLIAPSILDKTSSLSSVATHMPTTDSFDSMAEIASCSYEARQAGIKNGMFMGQAKRLCPDLQMIPYDFDGYKRVSKILYETVASYTHNIEAVSCDEMFVDITSVLEDTGMSPLNFARVLREEIQDKTQCSASAGLASNILLARLSTRAAKPNGQFYLQPDAVQEFIKTQPVRDLPGVGWSMQRRLQAMSLNTCEDLQRLSIGVLQKEFGPKTGQTLYQCCRGIDTRPIKTEHARKSVSAEINYGIRFNEDSEAVKFVTELAREVHRRLQAINMLGKTITLKLKVRHELAPRETSKFLGHGVCDNVAKSVTLASPTDKVEVVENESVKLLKLVKVSACDIRGVGIQISRLTSMSSSAANVAGHKSLLDFVNRGQLKPNTPKTVTTKTNILSSTTKEANKTRPHIPTMLDFISKQCESNIGSTDLKCKALDNYPATDVTPAKRLPPLPALPDFKTPSESGTPVARVVQDKGQFCVPTASQLDQSVLSALPDDIRCQIIDSYRSEDIKHDFTHAKTRSVGIDEPSTSRGATHPTPHCLQPRWDPQVLAELPTDIVDEIMEDRDQDSGKVQTGPIEALPSMSQIDPSFLEALPPELQQELHTAYQRQNKSVIPLKLSPKKSNGSSPTPSSKTSPFKIHRRHRPQKNSPSKKRYQKPADQPRIRDMIVRENKGLPDDRNKTDEEAAQARTIRTEDETARVDHLCGDDREDAAETCEDRVVYKPVNLCGAVRLQDVKNLLKEWMLASPELLDEDVYYIVDYLYQLILDRNLEMVTMVLRATKRLGERRGTSAWMRACTLMEDKVQDIIYETYGSRLKI